MRSSIVHLAHRGFFLAAFLIVAMAAASGCTKHSKPNYIYMPDMYYSPAVKAQKALMRLPVEGTVPRGYTPYHFTSPEEAGKALIDPLPPTHAVLMRGQMMFNTYCQVCHGPAGLGDGNVVPKIPRPPSLQSDKIRNWPDGSIFHIITRGQNVMPSYASQIMPEDRWAIIRYIRVLQRSQHPTPEDLNALEADIK
ncbi:MAG: cytochrome c [Oligoflexia bacterium]|nr:cytochrome c [Oligoflexia bacterium]